MAHWIPADEQRARDCEQAFQNGGPRVFVIEPSRPTKLLPCNWSAAMTVRAAFPGDTVYARRKVDGRYRWMQIAVPAREAA